jgi:PAS domain S-box-containing protein
MTENTPKILYIDDEEWNLTAFRFMFRDEFEVFTAGDTEVAEQILMEHRDIDVVISDQRMPDETGVQFFERMHNRLTCTERIILTGYSDIDAVIASINRAGVYFYLRKPWQEEEVRLVLRNAISSARMHKKLIRHQEIIHLIEEYVDEVIALTDLEGRYLYTSPAISYICGYSPEEIVGHAVNEFMHPDDVDIYLKAQLAARDTHQSQIISYRFRHKDGRYIQMQTNVQAVWKDKGTVSDFFGVSRIAAGREA